MRSFEIAYDAEEDVLEVTFDSYEQEFARTVPLNDHIFLFTDMALQSLWGLSFYSYTRLLGVSETEFTSLRELKPAQIARVLSHLSKPPGSLFFALTDPERLIARVNAPSLHHLFVEDEEE